METNVGKMRAYQGLFMQEWCFSALQVSFSVGCVKAAMIAIRNKSNIFYFLACWLFNGQ
jgi:hypothetical protein